MANLNDEITNITGRIQTQAKELVVLSNAMALIGSVDLSDVSYINVYAYDVGGSVKFALDSEKRNSDLVHRLAKQLHTTFTKEKSWTGESLDASATVDGITFSVNGYVPKTCHIVEHETPLTDDEIAKAKERALQNVKTVRVTREIICK